MAVKNLINETVAGFLISLLCILMTRVTWMFLPGNAHDYIQRSTEWIVRFLKEFHEELWMLKLFVVWGICGLIAWVLWNFHGDYFDALSSLSFTLLEIGSGARSRILNLLQTNLFLYLLFTSAIPLSLLWVVRLKRREHALRQELAQATSALRDMRGEYDVYVQQERDQLASFHTDTGGSEWTHSDDWGTGNPLREVPEYVWYGVRSEQGHVRQLGLPANNLSHVTFSHIPMLPFLRILNLEQNGITGQITSKIGELRCLVELNLNFNALTGTIPAAIRNCQRLKKMCFMENNLECPVPVEVRDLPVLTSIYLQKNKDFEEMWLRLEGRNSFDDEDEQFEVLQVVSNDNSDVQDFLDTFDESIGIQPGPVSPQAGPGSP